MDAFVALFEPHRLIFTAPLLFALFLGSLSVLGLFDLEAIDLDLDLGADTDFDFDVDADFDVDLDADVDPDVDPNVESDVDGGGVVLRALGLGMIPFSLLLIILCFSFGWLGLAFEYLWAASLAGWVGQGWSLTLALIPPALVGALAVTSPLARLLHPLFKDYGRAKDVHELIGTRATLTSGSVSPTFGSATAQLDHGGAIEISVRTHKEDNDLSYGDTVVIFDYDADSNLYYVAPLTEDDVTVDASQ